MLNNISKLLFPMRCPACRDVMEEDGTFIHNECRRRFRRIKEPCCFKCGRALQDVEEDLCPECRKKHHSYKYGLTLFEYNDTARQSMIDFKGKGILQNGDFYAGEIASELGGKLKRISPEVLIPVPITRRRRLERGFNQSEYIADIIGKKLGIPVDSDVLFRKGKGISQKLLSRRERSERKDSEFECVEDLPYKNICIVDDIYTTGNTIESCTRALLSAGAENVGFLTVFSGDMF